jgi:Rhamnan synthesis protein F
MTKLRREVTRVLHRVEDALRAPLDALARAAHDRAFDPQAAAIAGQRPLTAKVAVLVTFQPRGMARSVFETCRFLDAAGYAVLLVANAPLAEGDLDPLLALCWQVLPRPNRGYDFGGYRDAIRCLGDLLPTRDSLLLVNDSIWLPIDARSGVLGDLQADPSPFAGVALEKRAGRSKRRWHYQSFLLRFKPQALQSPVFRSYWTTMRLSDRKRVVLRHGEKGLSQAMFEAGLGGAGEATRSRFLTRLAQQDNGFLRRTLAYAAYEDPADLRECQSLLDRFSEGDAGPDAETWRRDTLQHMQRLLVWLPFPAVFGFAAIRLQEVAYMKKTSNLRVYNGMRWQYLRAVTNGDLPAPPPDILAEIQQSRMEPRLTTDPADPIRLPDPAAR